MRNYLLYFLVSLSLVFNLSAQENNKISEFQIKNPGESTHFGELVIEVDGKEITISDYSNEAWIVEKGKAIVFTGADGQGGYENEGQSLWMYNAVTKQKSKILSHYYMINAFGERTLSNGKTVFLVKMSDGGLGASYISVIDPERGEVFSRQQAEFIEIKGDKVTIGFYKEGDWEGMWREDVSEQLIPKRKNPRPFKKETFNLSEVINNDVIFNENVYEILYVNNDGKNRSLKKVQIYLWRVNDVIPGRNYILAPVNRYVNPKAPLKPTLEALFGKLRKDELDYGFSNPTFGLKFEGVSIDKGTAIIKISQSPNNRNYGSLGPFIFLDAIKKTAKQFPTVKNVKICGVGETYIDAELEKPFPNCSK